MIDNDANDEWFLSSIKRYKDLIMFDTGDPVFQVDLVDSTSICSLSEKGQDKRIIYVLSLPSKVIGSSHNCIVKQNSDLKIVSGVFPKTNPTQILAVYGNDKIVSSQEDTKGVVLYSLKGDSDKIVLDKTLNFPLNNPNMALIEHDKIVMTKFTSEECLVGDLNCEKISNSIIFDNNNDIIKPLCVDQNIVALSFKKSGITHLFDLRTNATIGQQINVADEDDPFFNAFADFLFYKKAVSVNSIFFLSKNGKIKIFDLRNLSNSLNYEIQLSTMKDDQLKLRFNPDNKDVISVSGFDDSIYLYNIKNQMTEIFRHDGHSQTELCERETIVSDHFWYDDEFVISCALNNSLNCWTANVTFNNIVV